MRSDHDVFFKPISKNFCAFREVCLSAIKRDSVLLKKLLSGGVDVDVRVFIGNKWYTPIEWMFCWVDKNAALFLLENGADIKPIVIRVAKAGDEACINLLLKNLDSDVEIKTAIARGYALGGHKDLVYNFLNRGDTSSQDFAKAAIQGFIENGDVVEAQYLQSRYSVVDLQRACRP